MLFFINWLFTKNSLIDNDFFSVKLLSVNFSKFFSSSKTIDAINITKPKRGRKAGINISTTTPKTSKENDELKDLIDENDDSSASTEEDTDNLAEDISIDISKEKTDEDSV